MTMPVLALLLALAAGDRHGYALVEEVAAVTAGAIRLGPGTLYRSLQRMRVDGLIEEIEEPARADDGDDEDRDGRSDRRRVYRITAAGRAAARDQAGTLAALVAAARARGVL